jgi:uncharacterized protein (TIGR03435 family)
MRLCWNRSFAASLVGFTLLCSSLLTGHAQEVASAPKLPVFTVLSVKQNKIDDAKPSFTFKPDGLSIRHYNPMWLIVAAYQLVEEKRVINAPSWTMNEFFDIEAKVDEADVPELAKMTKQQQLVLLQQVFESRFGLKFHYESRDFKVFSLVVAKNGPKNLTPTIHDDSAARIHGRYQVTYEDISMPELCLVTLSTEAQAYVIDKTGISGSYDFTLHWSRPDDLVNGAPSEEPLIFTAVQDQLGLKLIPTVAATKVLVIDHIERPSGN